MNFGSKKYFFSVFLQAMLLKKFNYNVRILMHDPLEISHKQGILVCPYKLE